MTARRLTTGLRAAALFGLLLGCGGWLLGSGRVAGEINRRVAQVSTLLSKPTSAQVIGTGLHRGLLVGIDGVSPVGTSDSTLVIAVGWDSAALATLVEYTDRANAFFRSRARLIAFVRSPRGADQVAKRLGVPDRWPRYYVVIKGADSLAFRTGGTVSLDEHRQLLSRLHPSMARSLPTIDTSAIALTTALLDANLQLAQSDSAGDDALDGVRTVIIAESSCSECRVREHQRRIAAVGLDTAPDVLLVVPRRATHVWRDAFPLVRIASANGSRGLIPELGLVRRDVPGADPVVLDVRGGVVERVRFLRDPFDSRWH